MASCLHYNLRCLLPFEAGAIDFDDPRTNCQHSFYQLIIHQLFIVTYWCCEKSATCVPERYLTPRNGYF
ncbi:unnamed protein product, partial [Vitis vinifera]|uniref:Uncharacterized protein n=1 Tax=Vitis vinifera TaxID=29760 RepID=D7U943_VITVI